MPNITIKKAGIEDINKIQELNNKLFEYEYERFDKDLIIGWPFSEEGTKYFTNIINNHIVYIAYHEDKAVGYLEGNTKVNLEYVSTDVAEIDNIYIEEEYRKLGIGTMLINSFKEYCKEKEIKTFRVNASYKNIKAIECYKKNGFIEHDLTLWCKI